MTAEAFDVGLNGEEILVLHSNARCQQLLFFYFYQSKRGFGLLVFLFIFYIFI